MTLGAPECSPFVAMLVEEVDSSLLQFFSDAILLLNSVMAQGFLGLPICFLKKREIGKIFGFGTSGYLIEVSCLPRKKFTSKVDLKIHFSAQTKVSKALSFVFHVLHKVVKKFNPSFVRQSINR